MLRNSEVETLCHTEVTLAGDCGPMEEPVLVFLWLMRVSVCIVAILMLPSNCNKDMKQTLSWMK